MSRIQRKFVAKAVDKRAIAPTTRPIGLVSIPIPAMIVGSISASPDAPATSPAITHMTIIIFPTSSWFFPTHSAMEATMGVATSATFAMMGRKAPPIASWMFQNWTRSFAICHSIPLRATSLVYLRF